ncbi:MAG: hypothetical protein GY714_10660 [Desulfobacterales bacterium]|nr:hypothetical protein [Desulfobacterales bacterium]
MKKIILFVCAVIIVLSLSLIAFIDSLPNNNIHAKTKKEIPKKLMRILNVSDFSFTSKGVQVVSISVGTDKNNYFNFTIPRSKVNKGLTGTSGGSALWSGQQYISSSKHPTHVNYSIEKFNRKTKEATILVDVKLIDTKSLSKYFIKKTNVAINANQFENLTKDIN